MAGKILLNGTDVTSRVYLVATSDSRRKYTLLGSKLTGWSTEVDAGTKKGLAAVFKNLDGFAGHVYKNGVVAPIAMIGSRPINATKLTRITGLGNVDITANANGTLTIAEEGDTPYSVVLPGSVNSTNVPYLSFNLALWGSGGKGGAGAYFFLQGNWGGVGGSGGGKAVVNITLRAGESIRVENHYETGSVVDGGETASETTRYYAYGTRLLFGDTIILIAHAGGSGISAHPRSGKMVDHSLTNETLVTFKAPIYGYYKITDSSGNIRAEFCVANATKGGYWVSNGNTGNASTFPNTDSGTYSEDIYGDMLWGNPELLRGIIPQTGSGGASVNKKYEQNRGSGGGGSYGNGGTAGDASGSSAGAAGSLGGGGGGAGSPAGGAQGGNGGLNGFDIFY